MSDAASAGSTQPLVPAEQGSDLLEILRRRWRLFAAFVILGALAACVYGLTQPSSFEARATLLLLATENEQSPGGGRQRTLDVDTWATVARSTRVLQQVADELDLELSEVRQRSTATAAPTGDILVLTFEGPDRDAAADGAVTYSEAFLAERQGTINAVNEERSSRLQRMAEDLTQQIEDISRQIADEEARGDEASARQLTLYEATQQLAIERLAQVTTELAAAQTDVEAGRVLIDPRTAVSQSGLGTPILLLSGLLLGGLVGFVVALLSDRLDRRYSSTEGASALGLREIARVPYTSVADTKRHAPPHGYSRLLTHLTFTARGDDHSGCSVLLLPVDSTTLPTDVAHSVAAALERSALSIGLVVKVWSDGHDDHGQDRTTWERIAESVRHLCGSNDLVVVPESPLDRSPVGLGLSALIDETLLLVSENTPTDVVCAAVEDIRAINVHTVQVAVVTDVPHPAFLGRRGR